ncbi:site-specific DNA-methyltransferase [uncultured Metabacillus sp.]|uniref:DNA-methyltransferase n=1 Tax=uncultured Metabacillus sp. TaxID=2860135 RepID=UPI00260F03FE|nr:site-specific DNA-methyltransferase [uncultured Metabacillus sp.]
MIELNKIHKEDCLEGMKKIEDNSINLVITDPPFKIVQGGAKTKGKNAMGGTLAQGKSEVSSGTLFKHNDIKLSDWIPEVYRVLEDGGFFYCFINSLNLNELLTVAKQSKFKLNNVLVMIKDNCVVNQWYMKNVEYVAFFRKGKAKPLNNRGIKTATNATMPSKSEKIHPTQKPLDYVQMLIENSSQENEIVFDPFMGSATTAIAAINANRQYLGFELDDEYYILGNERINNTYKNKLISHNI